VQMREPSFVQRKGRERKVLLSKEGKNQPYLGGGY